MKNFIKTIFAVLFGNIIFFGFFILVFVLMMIGLAVNSDDKKIKIKGDSILKLNINGALTDMSENTDFNFGNLDKDNRVQSIHNVIDAIHMAGKDNRIEALYLPLNLNSELSYAQLDLLRDAIKQFKTSKKPVLAYGEMSSQKSYYLASVADKIFINPNGGLDIRGFGAQLTFFKNALDKLEIQPQIFYAGKFKSATEPFRGNKMSEENKIQTRELLEDISTDVINNIAKDRKVSVADIQTTINNMETNTPMDAFNAKLIDGLKYEDEVEDEFKIVLKKSKSAELEYTPISAYIGETEKLHTEGKIAVYIAEGDIIDGKSNEESIGSETVVKDLKKIKEDDEIKGVVLRVNSPGGSALASAVMLREIELLRKKKPVVISMGNLAASGGYYISTSSERVFAEPHTITGSIGVFGIIPNAKNMLENKLGVTFDEVELNDHAVLGLNKALDEKESTKIQTEIDRIYHTFKSVVSRGRKLPMDSVESIAQGRVWSGERAKALHLVDEIGTLKDAINYMAKLVKVDQSDYRIYNKRKSDLELLFEDMSTQSLASILKEKLVTNLLGDHALLFNELIRFTKIRGAQMRMAFEVKI